jgi:hypothetical protein
MFEELQGVIPPLQRGRGGFRKFEKSSKKKTQ